MKVNHDSTEKDLDKLAIKSPLEHQIQQQEVKDSGRKIDRNNSMVIYFYKTGEINSQSYFKIPLRSNARLNIENDDKYCCIWSILAHLYPSKNIHPNGVSNYKQYLNELNINGFDFSNGFTCSNFHKFHKPNNLSINTFELKLYQDRNKWRYKLVTIEVSKNDSDRVIDLLIYKIHYALFKTLTVFLGDHHKTFICRNCLNS